MFCSKTALHTRGESLSPPFLYIPLYRGDGNQQGCNILYFLPVKQVTLEAVPSIPAEFQQETFPLKK